MPTIDRARLTDDYGWADWRGYVHAGIDAAGITPGTTPPIKAAADGVVDFVGRNLITGRNGRHIGIRHNDGSLSFCGHVERVKVRKGERVRRGQQIATMGHDGLSASAGVHLHFEHWRDADNHRTHHDPLGWLASQGWAFADVVRPRRLVDVNTAWSGFLGEHGWEGSLKGLQSLLRETGSYRGRVDGNAGPMTTTAVQVHLAERGYYKGRTDGNRGLVTATAEANYLIYPPEELLMKPETLAKILTDQLAPIRADLSTVKQAAASAEVDFTAYSGNQGKTTTQGALEQVLVRLANIENKLDQHATGQEVK